MDRLFSRVSDTVYATIYGTLAVAHPAIIVATILFTLMIDSFQVHD